MRRIEEPAFFFIVNPRAGLGGVRFSTIASRLRGRGVPFAAAATTGPGDATTLARLACGQGFRAIVCVGGDGTINEVVNGLVTPEDGVDQRPLLGMIPTGTAQDFSRGAGIPLERGAAIDRLLEEQETRVDVGRIRFGDGRVRLFVNVLGVGFDAEVAERAQDVRGAIPSIPAHVVGFASALAGYRNKTISISFDEREGGGTRFRCNMVAVANGSSYAGGMRLAPGASLDDGLLDIVVVGDVDKIEFLLNFPSVFTGKHVGHEKVVIYRAPCVWLESEEEALVQADGDVVGRLPAQVEVLPRALRLIR